MIIESRPVLEPHSVVAIRREGGLTHFPGLAAPRRIRCSECSEAQRRWLAQVLDKAAHCRAADEAPTGADRRSFHLVIETDAGPDAGEPPLWSLTLAEEQAPPALVRLWQQGRVEEA